jgi:AraC-like DNA-binding protein
MLRHRSALGEWEMASRPPSPRLREYVHGYQGYLERSMGFSRRIEAPSPVVPLIINFGPVYRVSGPGERGRPAVLSSFVAGLYESYALVEATGLNCGLQVNFTPLGARRFFGLPMGELTSRCLALDDLFGAAARRFVEQLERLSDWAERFDLLDTAIAGRLAQGPAPSAGIVHAWRRLCATHGRLSAGALASELGCSRKHLATGFRDQIGLPPSTVGRILRFNRALRLLEPRGDLCRAQVALDCGYFDQAHFNREFRAFTGRTPGDFLRRRLPDGGVLGD